MSYQKTYSTNSDLVHAWAYAENGERGKNPNQSLSFNGGELYSYNTAIFKRLLDKNICLENVGKYSVTTSAHQSLACNAYSGKTIIAAWENASHGFRFLTNEIIESYKIKLDWEINNLAKSKRESTRTRYQAEINHIATHLKLLLEYKIILKKDLTKDLKELIKESSNSELIEKLKVAKEKQLKKEKADQLKRLKLREKELKQEIIDFKEGNKSSVSYGARDLLLTNKNGQKFDLIRFISNKKEKSFISSQGITIDVEKGLFLYKLATKCRKNGAPLPNSEKLDIYTIEKIDSLGNAKVGCHYFFYDELEKAYNSYLLTLKK